MSERYAFGSAGSAGGVKEQSDVGLDRGQSVAHRSKFDSVCGKGYSEVAVGGVEVGFDGFDAEMGRSFTCGMGAVWENGDARTGVFHEEGELVGGVCGVEWCGDGAGAGYGKEGCDEFISVDEDDRRRGDRV